MKMKKITSITGLILLLISCSKKDDGPGSDDFDPSQFYITVMQDGAPVLRLQNVIVFANNGSGTSSGTCSVYSTDPMPDTYNYQYKDGHLKVYGQGAKGELFADFTIKNSQIANTIITDKDIDLGKVNIHMRRTPDLDAFNGKSFKGPRYFEGQEFSSVTFSFSGGKVSGTSAYTLINNGVAVKEPFDNNAALFVIVNGKLAFLLRPGSYGYIDPF